MKKRLFELAPWVITVVALYFAFRGLDWSLLFGELKGVQPGWIALAILLTTLSYLVRAFRWQHFFEDGKVLQFFDAAKVLILGFFMNNILPARTGELVRAHAGARVSGKNRTLVLATIASERLVDGLTISLIFVCFTLGLRRGEESIELLYVAAAFAVAAAGVLLTLAMRAPLFAAVNRIGGRINARASAYAVDRFQVFINGLSPLANLSKLPEITFWSLMVWTIELGVYVAVVRAFDAPLSLAQCVIFLVAVNFSSLIPSAPAGAGVIEAVASGVLMSLNVASSPQLIEHLEKHMAIALVLTQHAIQFLVVAIPGVAAALLLKKQIGEIRAINNE